MVLVQNTKIEIQMNLHSANTVKKYSTKIQAIDFSHRVIEIWSGDTSMEKINAEFGKQRKYLII